MPLNDFLSGEQIESDDPLDLIRRMPGASPSNAVVNRPVSPTAIPSKPVPPSPLINAVQPGGAADWRGLLETVGPLIASMAAGSPAARRGALEGWMKGKALAETETQKRREAEQTRNQAAAKFRLEVGQHALDIVDPVQRSQFIDLAEGSGVTAGLLKHGDLADLRAVPASQASAARLKELTDELDKLEKGYDLDKLVEGRSTIKLKDGSQVSVATALDLTRGRPLDADGNPIPKPSKIGNTEEERYIDKWAKEHGTTSAKMTSAQELAARNEFRSAGRAPTAPASVDSQFADLVELWKAGHPGQEPPAGVRTQLRIQAKKDIGQADDRPRIGGGPNGGLTDDAVDYAATQYRVTGVMPSLGMGSAEARAAIVNRTAAQAKALNQTAVMAMQKQAAFKSDATALTQMRKMSSAASAFETKAMAQADIVGDLSKKVTRTQWPIINDALLAGKANIAGDTNTQLLYNAIATFTTEYAKIMEGSTGSAAASSDSARKAAERLIKPGLNPATLQSTLDLMKREMRLTLDGYNATIESINERMGGPPPDTKTTTVVQPSSTPSYADYLKAKKGAAVN